MDTKTDDIRSWLSHWPQLLSQFDVLIIGLKRRYIGNELSHASPSEMAIGNLARRILFVIREEYSNKLRRQQGKNSHTSAADECEGESAALGGLSSLSINKPPKQRNRSMSSVSSQSSCSMPHDGDEEGFQESTYAVSCHQPSLGSVLGRSGAEGTSGVVEDYTASVDMRQGVMAAVNEILEEMENVNAPIASCAQDHIHSDECVMVIGQSYTIELFLKAASRKRRFQVIIASEGQGLCGHRMAAALSQNSNIGVTLVPDTAIYALMSRVHKVIFSPQAVMADGGAICLAGHLMTLIAAKEHAVPVVGVTGSYKLTPLFAHNQNHVLDVMNSPADVLPYDSPVDLDHVEVAIPVYDHVPPEYIDLYITNNGSHQPSYIYRLLAEFFHPRDYSLKL